VVTTARERDHDVVSRLGADVTIDFSAADYVPQVQALGEVDVVLDTVGRDTLTRSPLVLADRGRVVSIVDITEPRNVLADWGVNATYHFLFVSPGRAKLEALGRLVDQDELRPVIGRRAAAGRRRPRPQPLGGRLRRRRTRTPARQDRSCRVSRGRVHARGGAQTLSDATGPRCGAVRPAADWSRGSVIGPAAVCRGALDSRLTVESWLATAVQWPGRASHRTCRPLGCRPDPLAGTSASSSGGCAAVPASVEQWPTW
jgi:hypothetical protein